MNTPESIRVRVERKLLRRLLWLIFLLYFLFAVDRGNIGFAGKQMIQSLGLTAQTFGLGSGLFTLGFLLFQVPNATWMRRAGGGKAFAILACAWGLVSTSTAFVPNSFWFSANRFLLGVTEAGFAAFVIYYINEIFPGRLRGLAIGLTLVAVPISLIIASPLSGVLLNFKSAELSGWQFLFLVEGVPTIILGFFCFRAIPSSVETIRFLSEEERDWLRNELGPRVQQDENALGLDLKDSLSNRFVWALGYILFTTVFIVNVMLIWMPQVIQQLSHAGNVGTGGLNSIPWVALGLGIVFASWVSDKITNRASVLAPALGIAVIGFAIAAVTEESRPNIAFAGLLIGAFGGGAAQGVFWGIATVLISGARAATAYALITVLGNGSGVFAHPLIGRLHDATRSFAGVAWALAAFSLIAIVVSLLVLRPASVAQSRHSRG